MRSPMTKSRSCPIKRASCFAKPLERSYPTSRRADDTASVVANGCHAHLKKLVLVRPNPVAGSPVPQHPAQHRNATEQRVAIHPIAVGVPGDDAAGLVDHRHDVRPLAPAPRRILEPLGDILRGLEGAPPLVGFPERREDVPHRVAAGAVPHPFGKARPIGTPRPRKKLRIVADTVLELPRKLRTQLGPHHEVRPQAHQQYNHEVARNQLQTHVATPLRMTPPADSPF